MKNIVGETSVDTLNEFDTPQLAAKKIEELINEVNKKYAVWVCEKDDGDSISVPVSVEYNEEDKRIYINAEYKY